MSTINDELVIELRKILEKTRTSPETERQTGSDDSTTQEASVVSETSLGNMRVKARVRRKPNKEVIIIE